MHIGINELLVLVFVFGGLLVPIVTAIWVYRDATKRKNEHAVLWLFGTLLFFLPVIIVYLILRPDFRNKEPEAG